MSISINKEELYTIDDLNDSLTKIDSNNASIHYTNQKTPDDVVNHMPYNTGIFFSSTSDDEFLKKSIQKDIEFANSVF